MMKSKKQRIAVFLLVALCGAVTLGWIASSRQQAAMEAEARQQLQKLGVLVTLDGNRQHVQGIALLPSTKQADLEKAIQLIAQLPQLEVLRLASTGVTDEQLAKIANNTSLTMLGLNKTGISDEGIGHLKNLKNVKALYLNGTKVTAHGLEVIGKLRNLEILDLSETSLKGDLTPILPLNQLNYLLLSDVPLSDNAVQNLLRLKSLSRLTIHGSTVSDQAAGKLEKAGLKIDWEKEHTDGSSQADDDSSQADEEQP